MSFNDRTDLPLSDYYDAICNSKGSNGLTIPWGQTVEPTSEPLKIRTSRSPTHESRTMFGRIDGD